MPALPLLPCNAVLFHALGVGDVVPKARALRSSSACFPWPGARPGPAPAPRSHPRGWSPACRGPRRRSPAAADFTDRSLRSGIGVCAEAEHTVTMPSKLDRAEPSTHGDQPPPPAPPAPPAPAPPGTDRHPHRLRPHRPRPQPPAPAAPPAPATAALAPPEALPLFGPPCCYRRSRGRRPSPSGRAAAAAARLALASLATRFLVTARAARSRRAFAACRPSSCRSKRRCWRCRQWRRCRSSLRPHSERLRHGALRLELSGRAPPVSTLRPCALSLVADVCAKALKDTAATPQHEGNELLMHPRSP